MILDDDELRLLTGRKQSSAQCKVLQYLKIKYSRRPDGTVVVFEKDVNGPTAPKQSRSPTICL